LHPLAVILAVLAGAELDGVAGMFLAVPAVAIASVVCRHWLEWHRSNDVVNATFRVASARPHTSNLLRPRAPVHK
jgi:predicted PurR-regulated permease PerM